MEFKGTKGKWEVCDRTYNVQTAVDSSSHELRTIQTICNVNTVFISKEESISNAQLISKAPELLDMLKDIVHANKHGSFEYLNFYEMEQLIKSATELK